MSESKPKSIQDSEKRKELDDDKELGDFLQKSFLDLENIDVSLYRSKSLWKGKNARGVYGGQVIGQALMAASMCAPQESHMHSMHSYFLRPGDVSIPVLYHVDVTRAGRTYCATSVKATQTNKAIFTMQASFKREELNSPNYQIAMPKVPLPDELSSPEEVLNKYKEKDMISPSNYDRVQNWLTEIPIATKFVKEEGIVFNDSQRQTLWMKVKGHLADDLHPNIHKCCLAYMSDWYLLRTARMPLIWLHGTYVSAVSLDHSMWFHATAKVDEWMLFDIKTNSIGDGRTLVSGHVWDLRGRLVTTIAQEGVLRLHQPEKAKL